MKEKMKMLFNSSDKETVNLASCLFISQIQRMNCHELLVEKDYFTLKTNSFPIRIWKKSIYDNLISEIEVLLANNNCQ